MASKRSKLELLESPPSASPSSDGEESSSEEVTPLPKPASKKPQSESESESEETVPEPVVKPQASSKKPTPTAAKRPAETERGGKEPKKAKHAAEKTTPRLWSEEEEIALLKGMVDYEVKIGLSPSGDMDAFHAFVKKSLHMDASRSQVYEKLRRLKKKYWEKLKKDGAASSSWKHHDKKLFELSKKIWRNEANGLQSPAKPKKNENQSVPKKLETSLTPSVDGAKDEQETETEPERNLAPFMSLAVGKSHGDMQDYVILEGLKLVNVPQKAEFEERWAKLQKEELELYVEQSKLVLEQAKIVMEAKK